MKVQLLFVIMIHNVEVTVAKLNIDTAFPFTTVQKQ